MHSELTISQTSQVPIHQLWSDGKQGWPKRDANQETDSDEREPAPPPTALTLTTYIIRWRLGSNSENVAPTPYLLDK